MPEDKEPKTVDIDTSGPGADIELPEEKVTEVNETVEPKKQVEEKTHRFMIYYSGHGHPNCIEFADFKLEYSEIVSHIVEQANKQINFIGFDKT